MKDNNTYKSFAIFQKRVPLFFIFCFFWVLLSLIYLPAARAGFVTDFIGWLENIKFERFADVINRSYRTDIHSLYQFRELVTFLLYKILGTHAWLWHFLFVTLQAVVALLMYILTMRLLEDVGVKNSSIISLGGVLLFCMSPYISEVTVWKSCYHYLQGLIIILLILIWVQRYAHTLDKKYAIWAMIAFFLSTFSLEIFYVTPLLVLALGLFYRYNVAFGKTIFRKILSWFFLPELLLFMLYFAIFRIAYGTWQAHAYDKDVVMFRLTDLGKPARYFFHLIFMGRFFPEVVKQQVYDVCSSAAGICVFWGLMVLVLFYITKRFQKLSGKGKVAGLLFVCMLITTPLLIRIAFNGAMLIASDRYVYTTAAFFYLLVGVLISCITVGVVRIGIFTLFALLNLWFAIEVNTYWGQSHDVLYGLLHKIPTDGNKTIILLNIPETMHGAPMINAQENSEFKLMHDMLMPDSTIKQTVFDGMGYNMLTPNDGAHVMVINDSLIHVTLNQWSTWWWWQGKGAESYKNEDFRVNMIDVGHWYELTLKKPKENYILLYSVGDKWKVVDMANRNDQY